MISKILKTLSSPYLLPTTSVLSLTIAVLIKSHVAKSGPIPIAGPLIKANSILYAFLSLIFHLFLLHNLVANLFNTSPFLSSPFPTTLHQYLCSPSPSPFDITLRRIYHISKLYENIDIHLVLATGGYVNSHFGIHHFTTPYLTYFRVLHHHVGWQLFALLNTGHHAVMYAYFAGVETFSGWLPFTGSAQLVLGVLGEVYILLRGAGWGDCDGEGRGFWAHGLALGLLSVYGVLWVGELKGRGQKPEKVKVGKE